MTSKTTTQRFALLGAGVVAALGTMAATAGPAAAADLYGTGGDDRIVGTPAADSIAGFEGHDLLRGRGGADVVFGDDGNDRIYGGGGADTLFGSRGHDTLVPASGADTVLGGAGLDTVYVVNDGRIDFVNCGAGYDAVIYDGDLAEDTFRNCEDFLQAH